MEHRYFRIIMISYDSIRSFLNNLNNLLSITAIALAQYRTKSTRVRRNRSRFEKPMLVNKILMYTTF